MDLKDTQPKNYANLAAPDNRSVLCAELPLSLDDKEWHMSDEELGQLVYESLTKAGIPITAPLEQVFVRRLRFAYPIYLKGYEVYFERLDEWIGQFPRLLTFGRQGLFAHDNTHHALLMAYRAVECLDQNGVFDKVRWDEYRKTFSKHVVED